MRIAHVPDERGIAVDHDLPAPRTIEIPDLPPGSERVQSNDVFVDGRGLIYLLDRVRGLNILDRT